MDVGKVDVAQPDVVGVVDAARERLANAGYDPVYGARPLKRAIQQQVEDPLAQEILKGAFGPGDIIRIDSEEKTLKFEKAA